MPLTQQQISANAVMTQGLLKATAKDLFNFQKVWTADWVAMAKKAGSRGRGVRSILAMSLS